MLLSALRPKKRQQEAKEAGRAMLERAASWHVCASAESVLQCNPDLAVVMVLGASVACEGYLSLFAFFVSVLAKFSVFRPL